MSKELFISSSPHETKVAVLEDDQLVEVYFERDTDVGLVGGIYKGRVSRVLPGMQSAFVDIGLERDAFLYVSDFFEDAEEYEKIVEEAEARVLRDTGGAPVSGSMTRASAGEPSSGDARMQKPAQASAFPAAPSEPSEAAAPEAGASPVPPSPGVQANTSSPTGSAPPSTVRPAGEGSEYRRPQHRGRRRRGRGGRGFGEHKFAPRGEIRDSTPPRFEILPGESLAKYSRGMSEAPSPAIPAAPSELAAAEPARVDASPMESNNQPVQSPKVRAPEQGETSLSSSSGEPAQAKETSMNPPLPAPDVFFMRPEEPGESPVPPDRKETGSTKQAPASEVAPAADLLPSPAVLCEASGAPGPALSESSAAATPPASFQKGPSHEEAAPAETTPPSAVSQDANSLPRPSLEVPSETAERSYTLREPHQRPRFAPKRGRRGRRGMGRRLPRAEATSKYEPSPPGTYPAPQIAELLKEGQEILVQIAKEPLGRKGARITSHIALPGRYLVYMPTINHIGVSRKIPSEGERLRLRNIVLENRGSLTGGFIVRTAGEGRPEEEFKADLKFLSTLWNEIKTKAEHSRAPALIHRDLELVQRILRDILSPDFKSIRVDNEVEYERVLDFVSRLQPSLVGQVKLYTRDTPLFEEFGIQGEIEKALKPKVWLKSGGYIVVNQTEALVAIDVNTGKYVGKTNRLEDTIVKTNIDAVNEIVRQIRLRDLGGIIVIDFIDMDERRNRNKVVQALEEALRRDRAPTKILSFNDFGLVALTRKRVKHSLERTLCEPCQYCSASGWIKSVTTVCYEILAEARKMASQIEGRVLTLRVNPEVAHALKSRDGRLVAELESLVGKDVIIKSDPTVHQERFEIF